MQRERCLGIGVDVVDIPRMNLHLAEGGKDFLDACWTKYEQAYCRGDSARLAARWAAKEAIMKSMGEGIGKLDPRDIEVRGEHGQRPEVELYRSAKRVANRIGVSRILISLSHDGPTAIAFATMLGHG